MRVQRLRYRPFGPVASTVEVLVGLYILVPTVRNGGWHWSWSLLVGCLVSAMLLGSGALSLTLYLRRRVSSRRTS